MERAYLGGIEVSRTVLGCGNFGGIGSAPELFGRGDGPDEAFVLMDAAWEAGITTFDTADAYGGGRSESTIGDWLRSRKPDGIVLSTKTFAPMDAGADHGLAPARVKRQVESSLGRLGVDRVDLFLTHAWDDDVPISETAGALDELVAEGKIGAYGCSNVDGPQLAEALDAGAFRWVQNSYSLLDRDVERDVLPLCAVHGLGFTPFSPLTGGWLTGKYRRGEAPPEGSRMTLRPGPYESLQTDETFDRIERLAELGDPATLALGWLFGDPRVTAVIVGPRRPEQLRPAVDALAQPLTAAQRDELSRLFSRPLPGA
jgi:aryl-alcohol dehydrogenase-like predicted oxidoreductase